MVKYMHKKYTCMLRVRGHEAFVSCYQTLLLNPYWVSFIYETCGGNFTTAQQLVTLGSLIGFIAPIYLLWKGRAAGVDESKEPKRLGSVTPTAPIGSRKLSVQLHRAWLQFR
eukprot:GHVU01166771.1.p1 GENE.GHVU01166771.1~~GHVU01166771.1.p1  ORF type:complete len:112 (-),score=0.09 GHVU01166771.1:424-759(-)